MSYLKPQTPIQLEDNYIYPLTTADQVIVGNGNRLNSLFKKTIQENIILRASNWSETLPYTQTITLTESVDDYKVDANVIYTGNDNTDSALNKAAGCLSYIKKNHKEITFYCLKKKPEIDIPIEITGTCRNTIATVQDGIKLNFDIVAYGSEEALLSDSPADNTIGVVTNTTISGYRFSATEPTDMKPGEVWIKTDKNSDISFDIVDNVTVYPISAKQFINDSLTNLEAYIRIGGDWVQFSYTTVYIIKNGVIQPGYSMSTTIAYNPNQPGSAANGDGYIEFSGGAGSHNGYFTSEKISLSNFTSIHAEIDVVKNICPSMPGACTGTSLMAISDKIQYTTPAELYLINDITPCYSQCLSEGNNINMSVEIPSGTVPCYVGLHVSGSGISGVIRIKNFWLE